MERLKIGKTIQELRKNKGVTQEQLAGFLSLSTPAVSKWESGQAYPDITLLPKLAAYFGISIDNLLDYSPDLDEAAVIEIYDSLYQRFGKEELAGILADCRELLQAHYGCRLLEFRIGALLLNSLQYAAGPEQLQELTDWAADLFTGVSQDCHDAKLALSARCMLASCRLLQQKPDEVITLLSDLQNNEMAPEILLATAWQQKGELPEARKIMQHYIFTCLAGIINACPVLAAMYPEEEEIAKKCLYKALQTAAVFDYEASNPVYLFSARLQLASIFAKAGDEAGALAVLEEFVAGLEKQGVFAPKIVPDSFFDTLETMLPPKNAESIKQSLLKCVEQNPDFLPYQNSPRFMDLLNRLRQVLHQ